MSKVIFGIAFLIIVLLTLSHVVWDFSTTPSFFGLPVWLFWYMFLHIILIGVLMLFIKDDKLKNN